MFQHHRARKDSSGRVRDPFAGNIRRGAVGGLEHGVLLTDIPGRGEAQAASGARSHVREDVSV
jgi:hypothetical protein